VASTFLAREAVLRKIGVRVTAGCRAAPRRRQSTGCTSAHRAPRATSHCSDIVSSLSAASLPGYGRGRGMRSRRRSRRGKWRASSASPSVVMVSPSADVAEAGPCSLAANTRSKRFNSEDPLTEQVPLAPQRPVDPSRSQRGVSWPNADCHSCIPSCRIVAMALVKTSLQPPSMPTARACGWSRSRSTLVA